MKFHVNNAIILSLLGITQLSVPSVLAFMNINAMISNRLSVGRTRTTATISDEISYKEDLDVDSMLEKSSFPIRPVDLISLAKQVMIEKGVGTLDGGDCLADDFVFRAQFVEVDKTGLIGALSTFNLANSFDVKQQFFGWTVDPVQPNRVWVFNRQEATHVKDFFGVKPTGKTLVLPPQTFHLDFNDSGKVIEFGFYTVDRAQGNTGGLGGAFGYFYGVGRPLPFPEGRPYKMSLQRSFVELLANFARKFQKKNKD
jgi:hypothetical protein